MYRALWTKAWRDLVRQRAQTAALVLLVALGISSLVALTGAYRNLSRSYRRTYDDLRLAHITFSLAGAPEEVVEEVLQVEGVEAALGRLTVEAGYLLPDGTPVRSRLVGVPPAFPLPVNDLYLEAGRPLTPGDGQAAVLERHFARAHGLAPGDRVTPILNGKTVPFTLAGVAASPEYLIVSPSRQEIFPAERSFAVLFVPLSTLQELTGRAGEIDEVGVRLDPEADREAVARAIAQVLAPYGLQETTFQEELPSAAALKLDLDGYRELAVLMPGLLLLAAALSIYVLLERQIRAQQPQIGLMKALGYGDGAVQVHYLSYALLIGLLGSLAGLGVGFPLARTVTRLYAEELGIPLIQVGLYPDLVAISLGVSLLVLLLAAYGPSRRALALTPAQAMRIDPSVALARGRTFFFEGWLALPLWARLALRGLLRVRRRSLTTFLGIVSAFVLVLSSLGMVDTMNLLLDEYFRGSERWSLWVLFDVPQAPPLVKELEGWEGVQVVEPVIQLPATLQGAKEADVLLLGVDPEIQLHRFPEKGDGEPRAALEAGELVVTTALAGVLDLRVGEEVPVRTPFGVRRLRVGAVVEEVIGPVAYVSAETVQGWTGSPVRLFNGLYLKVDPGRQEEIRRALYRLPGVAGVQPKDEIEAAWRGLMGLFYAFMGVIVLFAAGMAAALLFNAVTVNVLERQRELATMRALGAGMGLIARLLLAEGLFLWLFSLVPGLLLGHWAAAKLGESFNTELFTFAIRIRPVTDVGTALGILLILFLATWPAIRHVARLNLAEATKMLT